MVSATTEFRIRAVTEIWTGDAKRQNARLRETSFIGSMRWWYEALVRGFGGYACGALNGGCGYDPESKVPRQGQICAACELFGCTGWSRKFRLRLCDAGGKLLGGQVAPGEEFVIQLVWLRDPLPEELWLLSKSLEIASRYGSICGRNTLKPQSSAIAGKDYGLIEVIKAPEVCCSVAGVRDFLLRRRSGEMAADYPDFRWFFFYRGSYLDRSAMNSFFDELERRDGKDGTVPLHQFMRGRRGESKKVFSFRAEGGRIWGYTRQRKDLFRVVDVLENQFGMRGIRTGEEVMESEL